MTGLPPRATDGPAGGLAGFGPEGGPENIGPADAGGPDPFGDSFASPGSLGSNQYELELVWFRSLVHQRSRWFGPDLGDLEVQVVLIQILLADQMRMVLVQILLADRSLGDFGPDPL